MRATWTTVNTVQKLMASLSLNGTRLPCRGNLSTSTAKSLIAMWGNRVLLKRLVLIFSDGTRVLKSGTQDRHGWGRVGGQRRRRVASSYRIFRLAYQLHKKFRVVKVKESLFWIATARATSLDVHVAFRIVFVAVFEKF